jgi:alkanesulfonate monooxygenase SsuD/methylene tetrahydromethanopterin reductase-like flavin-dependent oxidoreductase (luciferase family)
LPAVRHGLFFPPFGELAEPARVVELAVEAEAHGWDGVFLWDHMIRPAGQPQELADAWTVLTAVAAATERIRLGPMVTPLARRRPHKVARETVTLDRLSGGRLVLGVGLGVNSGGELERFGEEVDDRVRAARLDEALDLLLDLWSGGDVDHHGPHFTAQGVRFLPTPVQSPRIPIWAAARGEPMRPGPLRRAARLDGLFPVGATPERLAEMVSTVRGLRGSLEGFEVAAEAGPDADQDHVDRLVAAGATWILRSLPVDVTAGEVRRLATTVPAEVGGR